ncbi:MAG: alpha/beta hydrolase [Provencibacterium sp.]|jgi:dienelactone hydrolase|nr:alpha/beta hydrolase [Provencibacterium sp.]
MEKRLVPPLMEGTLSREGWEQGRRAELLRLLGSEVYGITPKDFEVQFTVTDESEALQGKALRRLVQAQVSGPYGTFTFPFVAFFPKGEGMHPAIIFINNREKHHTDPDRKQPSGFWPVEEMVARGYAAAAFHTWDVDTDCDDGFQNGIERIFEADAASRPDDAWGALGAWAFAASRICDWLLLQPQVDAQHIAVVGHSRGGKTALWCAAQDERIYSAYSSCSGCSGAAVTRGKKGERVAQIVRNFPYWFCKNYRRYAGREEEMPFEQHMLLALCAPRPLYIGSATEDEWADPESEFLSARLAGEAYALYHLQGVAAESMPAPEMPVQAGQIGYHLRTGKHDLTPYDWGLYMDFLDQKIGR